MGLATSKNLVEPNGGSSDHPTYSKYDSDELAINPRAQQQGVKEASATSLGSVGSDSHLGWYAAAGTVSSCHGNADILANRFGDLGDISSRESRTKQD